ncbi:MAG: hypothetical protein AAFY83_10445 [Pseudomonadota bacterium]
METVYKKTTSRKVVKGCTEEIQHPFAVELDIEKYISQVEDFDLTEQQKREFLETLWAIMVSFVDLGFGIHPVQEVCGKLLENSANPALTAPIEVQSLQSIITEHITVSNDTLPEKGESHGDN